MKNYLIMKTEKFEVSTNNEVAEELGPLKYLSGLTGIPMDKIINYLLLIIIFVFDPLAIALVIAANFAFEQSKTLTFIPNSIKIRQPLQSPLTIKDKILIDKENHQILKLLQKKIKIY